MDLCRRFVGQKFISKNICSSLEIPIKFTNPNKASGLRHICSSSVYSDIGSCPSPSLIVPSKGVFSSFSVSNTKFCRRIEDATLQEQQIIPARCIPSTRGWLGLISLQNLSLHLYRPGLDDHNRECLELPSVRSLPSQLCEVVSQLILNGSPNKYFTPQVLSRFIVRNFVLSSEPYEKDCIVMALHGQEKETQLVYCRPQKDKIWRVLHDSKPLTNQLVYSDKGKIFFTLGDGGNSISVEAWDVTVDLAHLPAKKRVFEFSYESLMSNAPKFKGQENFLRHQCKSKRYLVVDEPSGDLLLVIKHYAEHIFLDDDIGTIIDEDSKDIFPYKTLRFDVYKFDFDRKRLKYLKSLDDRVLFLGLNHSFCLSSKDNVDLKPNSIYFLDDFSEKIYSETCSFGGRDMGIYDLANRTVENFPGMGEPPRLLQPCLWVAPISPSRNRISCNFSGKDEDDLGCGKENGDNLGRAEESKDDFEGGEADKVDLGCDKENKDDSGSGEEDDNEDDVFPSSSTSEEDEDDTSTTDKDDGDDFSTSDEGDEDDTSIEEDEVVCSFSCSCQQNKDNIVRIRCVTFVENENESICEEFEKDMKKHAKELEEQAKEMEENMKKMMKSWNLFSCSFKF